MTDYKLDTQESEEMSALHLEHPMHLDRLDLEHSKSLEQINKNSDFRIKSISSENNKEGNEPVVSLLLIIGMIGASPFYIAMHLPTAFLILTGMLIHRVWRIMVWIAKNPEATAYIVLLGIFAGMIAGSIINILI